MEGASTAIPAQTAIPAEGATAEVVDTENVGAGAGTEIAAGEVLNNTETAEQTQDALNAEAGSNGTEMVNSEQTADPVITMAAELFPEQQFASPQEAMTAIGDYVKGAREYEQTMKDANKALLDIFNTNPEIVQLLRYIKQGATFTQALPRVIDVDMLAPAEGDPDWDEWNNAKEERANTLSRMEQTRNEVTENLSMSMQEVEQFAQENNMSGEDAAELLTAIDELLDNVSRGRITKDILAKLKKGLFYERDLQNETEVAEIRGRNEAIEAKIDKEEKPKGDGLPDVKTVSMSTEPKEADNDPTSQIGRNIDSFVQSKRF